MRNVGIFVAGSLISGLIAFVGCSSSSSSTGTAGTGGNTSTTSGSTSTSSGHTTSGSTSTSTSGSTSTSTSGSTSSGAGGAGGSNQGVGGGPANFACNIPTTLPSNGSCVTFMQGANGTEEDAGLDDAGDPSITNCDPVTNAGCTGTDVCNPDFNSDTNMNYFCQAAGSQPNVAVCGNCTSINQTCGAGGLCIPVDHPNLPCTKDSDCSAGTPVCDTTNGFCVDFFCGQMCCGDTDCGSSGQCDITDFGLPSNVGVCIPM